MKKSLSASIVQQLEAVGSADNVAGMARFGIITRKAFGVSAPVLKQMARDIKRATEDRHALARDLWAAGFHESRLLAALIDDPRQVTSRQMNAWAREFDNWAICDSVCGHLFCRTPLAYDKAFEWAAREEEFIKRAGLVLMAWLAVHDKAADDAKIAQFLPLLESKANDDRPFVRKAVNWALRQIGKRSLHLNRRAIATAEKIYAQQTRSARWVATDALRELKSESVQERLRAKAQRAAAEFE